MNTFLLPDALNVAIRDGLNEITTNYKHRLTPGRRIAIYDAFGPKRGEARYRARTWLAILAAQRALPLYERALLNEDTLIMPLIGLSARALIDMSRSIMLGTLDVNDPVVEGYLHKAHHETGGGPFIPTSFTALIVRCAFSAAECCLSEAMGVEGLRYLHLDYPDDDLRPENVISKRRIEDEEVDFDLALSAGGDAAGAAAIACSWDTDKYNTDRLKAYWEWWLTEAVPTAWKSGVELSR